MPGTVAFLGEEINNINVVNFIGTYNVASTDYTIVADTTSGNITVMLPFAPDNGRILNIKNAVSTGNTLTINPNGQTIDRVSGNISITLTESRTFQYSTTPINTWYEL